MLRVASSVLFGRGHGFLSRGIPAVSSICWRLHLSTEASPYYYDSSLPGASRSPQALNEMSFEGYRNRGMIWRECKEELSKPQGDNFGQVLYNMKLLSGRLVVEPPAVKVKLAEDILEQIRNKGVKVNVGMYNILLRVYNSNDHEFSPSEFLENMEKENVPPNSATINLLFKAYCNQGNMHNASKLLDHMKTADMNIPDHEIHAALITGHARSDNIEDAEKLMETVKDDYRGPIDMAYSSLIRAYAERGNIDAIEKTLDDMRTNRFHPSVSTYFGAMNSLSKHGHSDLVSRVFDRLNNKDWVSSDLRTLACNCLVRGEVGVPRMLIKQLAKNGSLHSFVVSQYIITCIEKGDSVAQTIADLRGDVDFKLFPRIYETVIFRLIRLHDPVVVGKVAATTPPKPGDLAPLPDGNAWVKSVLEWYSFVTSEGHSNVIPISYYYPLLARCCSDVNMEGFLSSWKQLSTRGLSLTKPMKFYIDKMMANASMSLESYVASSMNECEVGSDAYKDAALWGFLFYCTAGKLEDALKLVENFKENKFLLDKSPLVSSALKSGCKLPEHSSQLLQLLKSLHDLPHPPDLNNIINYISSQHLNRDKPISDLLDLYTSLEKEGISVKTGSYIHLITKFSTNKDKDNFRSVYKKLMNDCVDDIGDGGYVIMFTAAAKTDNYGIGRTLYDLLPTEISDREDIRCNYLLCLSSWKYTLPRAVELLNVMLSEDQRPRFINWFRLIPQVLLTDPALAQVLLEKMKSSGYEPNRAMRHRMLELYVQQGLVEDAGREMAAVISSGWASREAYSRMIKLWSDEGNVKEVEKLLEEMKHEVGDMDAKAKGSMLIKAHIKCGNYDDALATLTEMDSAPPSLATINSMLVEFNAAGKSLDPVLSSLKKMSLSLSSMNSLLFFVHVDSGREEDAISSIKDVDIHPQWFKFRMSHANAPEYLRVLKSCEYHLRDENSADLVNSGYRHLKEQTIKE